MTTGNNGFGDRGTSPVTQPLRKESVQAPARWDDPSRSSIVFQLATIADDITSWGQAVTQRDRQLREFWPTEPILSSAVYSIVARNSGYSWSLDGPPRTAYAAQSILHEANFGKGWQNYCIKLSTDLYTQDNGAFTEIIRTKDSPEAPVIGIANLDALRCVRTGRDDEPVIYYDRYGGYHRLKWYQVIDHTEFPSPIETMNGVQLCAVSRVLRAAQYLRDIGIYKREKASGSNPGALYLVGGVTTQAVEDAMGGHSETQSERGYIRYLKPVILASLDPTKDVSVAKIDLKSLPDDFDEEKVMRWYINQLAMGFGVDYQDFAPLPGRSLGSGAQSLVLAMKSAGKGPALFMKMLEHQFNFHGVLPRTVSFRFQEKDVLAEREEVNVGLQKAQTRAIYLVNGVLTPNAVRQQMLDSGEISQEEFDILQTEGDVTPDIEIDDSEGGPGQDAANKGKKRGLVQRIAGLKKRKPEFAERYRKDAEKLVATDMQDGMDEIMADLHKAAGTNKSRKPK